MPSCIYCRDENREPSGEHVIAAALGGALELPPALVCKPCNGAFDREIDRPVRDDLDQIVVDLGIPNRRGKTASREVAVLVDGEERKFLATKGEVRPAERRKLLRKDPGGKRYEFRADSAAELEQARLELQRKNPDATVLLSEIEERFPPALPDERTEIDFAAPHWARWASKTAVNVLAYVFGREFITRSEFDDLREHARHGGVAPKGLLWGGTTSSEDTSELPTRHEIKVEVNASRLSVRVMLFGYCGLELQRAIDAPDFSRAIVLDAETTTVESAGG